MNDRPERPAHKELGGKLAQARNILSKCGYFPIDAAKLGSDFYSLSLFTQEEQHEALTMALLEAAPIDYRGTRPPPRSFEKIVEGEEMFEFIWQSGHFNRKMYVKFCLHGSGDDIRLGMFSLHEQREPKQGRK